MLVGPDEHKVALVELTSKAVTDVDDGQWHTAYVGRGDYGRDVDVREAQQSEANAEEVEDRRAVREEDAGWSGSWRGRRQVAVHRGHRRRAHLGPDDW